MKNNKPYYLAWGGLYALCAGLSFLPDPQGALKGLLTVLSVAFFVPPAVILYRAVQAKKWTTVHLLGYLSGTSLVLTLVFLVLNFLPFRRFYYLKLSAAVRASVSTRSFMSMPA